MDAKKQIWGVGELRAHMWIFVLKKAHLKKKKGHVLSSARLHI